MLPEKVDELMDRQEWLEPLSKQIQKLVRDLFNGLGEGGRKIQNLIHGTWLGHPVHSVLTDIPIGAWTAAVTLDALEVTTGKKGFGKGADAAILLGVGGAVGSAVSGITDWQHTSGAGRRYGLVHALLNLTSLGLYTYSLIARAGNQRATGRALAMSGYLFTLAAGYLGGELVYRYKVGVTHAPEQPISPRYLDVTGTDDLPDGQMKKVVVDDVPVLLVRRGEQIFAIAETCAHAGGPLSDGELRDDNSVVCPWHGSRYDLGTGKDLDGPSVYPQPCYEARIRDNRIEIRERDL